MPLFLLILALGVLAYFIWRARTSSLTRDCRWRQNRTEGTWTCAFCGAKQVGEATPRHCLRSRK